MPKSLHLIASEAEKSDASPPRPKVQPLQQLSLAPHRAELAPRSQAREKKWNSRKDRPSPRPSKDTQRLVRPERWCAVVFHRRGNPISSKEFMLWKSPIVPVRELSWHSRNLTKIRSCCASALRSGVRVKPSGHIATRARATNCSHQGQAASTQGTSIFQSRVQVHLSQSGPAVHSRKTVMSGQ